MMKSDSGTPFDPQFLEILACPRCKGRLTLETQMPALRCDGCRVRYPIRSGIPVLLEDAGEAI